MLRQHQWCLNLLVYLVYIGLAKRGAYLYTESTMVHYKIKPLWEFSKLEAHHLAIVHLARVRLCYDF